MPVGKDIIDAIMEDFANLLRPRYTLAVCVSNYDKLKIKGRKKHTTICIPNEMAQYPINDDAVEVSSQFMRFFMP